MFMTQRSTERMVGRPFGTEQFWRWVELPGDEIWLYVRVRYSRPDNRTSGFRIYMLSDLDDLEELLEGASDDFFVQRVVLVVPDDDLYGPGIHTYPVKELRVAVDRTCVSRLHLVTLEDGRVYMAGKYDDADAIEDSRLIYLRARDSSIPDAD